MKLKWYGHASFLVSSDDGTLIVTDPYPPEQSGYAPVKDEPHVVIMSSDNDSFHCRADLIPGRPNVINALDVARNGGARTVSGVEFHAIAAMEALNHAFHDPDQNAMYRFTVDGISVGHMGDVGNAFSDEQFEFFRGVDVLLALAGGHPTIELDDLKTIIDRTRPRYVVPMHFRTLTYRPRNSFWIESFLDYFGEDDLDFAFAPEVTLTRASLPEPTRVLVLDYVHPC